MAQSIFHRFFISLLLITPLLANGQGLSGLVNQTTSFLPVEEAYQLEVEITGPQELRLYWQIEDAYYLYQHRFKALLEDVDGSVPVEFEFSPALDKNDEFFGDVSVYYHYADLRLLAGRQFSGGRLSITSQGCADAGLCYPPHTEHFLIDAVTGAIRPDTGDAALPLTPANAAPGASDSGGTTLWLALLFAFLGGIILNAMPCVFPILSLKVLSFATGDPAAHHRHAWWYLLGVVASFVAVASALITLQGMGSAIGWGFQLQSPGFVIGLAYLFTAMALSLSGLVQFGGGLMNIGSTLAGQGGHSGSFFTGVLAVVVASPCTAPFMGSALGFALTQPLPVALSVFVALGLGMASPMVLLSYSRLARSALPRPGAWMETLKEFLAFPLYATAVWLLWVAGKQAGVDTMAAALAGLVMLALGLWLYRGSILRRIVALICLGLAVTLATFRGPDTGSQTAGTREGTVTWTASSLQGLRAEGVPVFVDVTADWCITCLANEQAVLFTDEMTEEFADRGVVYMVADWTQYDPVIGEFVNSHGRSGIPLYVMYPPDGAGEPFLLPQLLTRTIVLDALDRVTQNPQPL
ncbi:MAG: protein-disulfide reductase DsbD [Luminiphilus sp.]|nr:protein-disulfide reductase DsbD [Luminiphilus sp.]